jgi:hypothetical protein
MAIHEANEIIHDPTANRPNTLRPKRGFRKPKAQIHFKDVLEISCEMRNSVALRLCWEVPFPMRHANRGRSWLYKRLAGISDIIWCPNAEQAERMIELLRRTMAACDGKLLGPELDAPIVPRGTRRKKGE